MSKARALVFPLDEAVLQEQVRHCHRTARTLNFSVLTLPVGAYLEQFKDVLLRSQTVSVILGLLVRKLLVLA